MQPLDKNNLLDNDFLRSCLWPVQLIEVKTIGTTHHYQSHIIGADA